MIITEDEILNLGKTYSKKKIKKFSIFIVIFSMLFCLLIFLGILISSNYTINFHDSYDDVYYNSFYKTFYLTLFITLSFTPLAGLIVFSILTKNEKRIDNKRLEKYGLNLKRKELEKSRDKTEDYIYKNKYLFKKESNYFDETSFTTNLN